MQHKVILFVVISVILFTLVDSKSIVFAIGDNISTGSCTQNITINNENVILVPVFQGESPILSANINGTNISNVWLESNFNGNFVSYNNVSHILDLYLFTIPSYDLGINEVVSWRYKANNSCGAISQGSLQSFLVLGTNLVINPSNPDGENGWYKTTPLVSLSYNGIGDTFYRFDAMPNLPYTGTFNGTEDDQTGGISTIRYYSIDDSGRMEPLREFITKVDFSKPEIIHEMPEENSVSNNMPLVKAKLKELYQGNSGLDDSSVIVLLDGEVVSHEYISFSQYNAEVRYQVSSMLVNGTHNASVFVKDFAGNSNLKEWNFYVNNDQFKIHVISPLDESTSNKKRVLFNIEIDKIIQKLDLGINSKFSKLCSNCNNFNKTRTLKEGLNNITVRGENYGNFEDISLQVYVDTIKPKIKNTGPKSNQVTNGTFRIIYSEGNLDWIKLFWRSQNTSYNEVNLDNCISGESKECIVNVDLSNVENQEIDYFFRVSDSVNEVESKIIEGISVDTIWPIIEIISPINASLHGNRVLFDLNISEETSLSYMDNDASHPVLRNLCRKCNLYNKEMVFSEGDHDILFYAKDAAGNSGTSEVSFNVLD